MAGINACRLYSLLNYCSCITSFLLSLMVCFLTIQRVVTFHWSYSSNGFKVVFWLPKCKGFTSCWDANLWEDKNWFLWFFAFWGSPLIVSFWHIYLTQVSKTPIKCSNHDIRNRLNILNVLSRLWSSWEIRKNDEESLFRKKKVGSDQKQVHLIVSVTKKQERKFKKWGKWLS